MLFKARGKTVFPIVNGKHITLGDLIIVRASGKCGDNAYWQLYNDGTLEISGTGGLDNYSTAAKQPYREYIDEITQIKVKEGITSISLNNFNGCTNLALTELPSGLTTIGTNAFNGCTNLALTELPSGVTSIGGSAFRECTNLALTELPSGLTTIDTYVFRGCTNLALTELPSGLTAIGTNAFNGCTNLALTELPSALVTIGTQSFQNCTSLAISEMPSGVTEIGGNAFRGTGITSMRFFGTPTTIASNAFTQCNNLLNIYVPWEEGEVANAPWGATKATIHYNYTGDTV